MKVNDIISTYGLLPHHEGGFYREVYRSNGTINGTLAPDNFPSGRNYSTSIYFLLSKKDVSKLHMIKSDETWHFYAGGPLTIVEFNDKGKMEEHILGQDIARGQLFQYTVTAGCWFGCYTDSEYSFVGCTVAPGFDFMDFKMADRAQLLRSYPYNKNIIEKLS